MRKIMMVSLIAVILGVGFILAQGQVSPQVVTIAASGLATHYVEPTLSEISARGEVTVIYANAEIENNLTEQLLAELSAQGFVNIDIREDSVAVVYALEPTLSEISARGEVTVTYASAEIENNLTKQLLAELSAQGFVNIHMTHEYEFKCVSSPELRELSAQGIVTVTRPSSPCIA